MILSILIPVTPHHEEKFSLLYHHLDQQIKDNNEVEILHTHSPAAIHGGPTTGSKRQKLLQESTGEYVVFIDADDWVPEYYVDEMLRACASGCDCVAINGIMTTDGAHEVKWYLSKDMQNRDVIDNGRTVYHRHTNHITAVKREIALRAGFPDKSNAEDKYYSDRLQLMTEFKIDKPMYHYKFTTHNKQYK